MFLARFRWYRRWRGGKWVLLRGVFWSRSWLRIPDYFVERPSEWELSLAIDGEVLFDEEDYTNGKS